MRFTHLSARAGVFVTFVSLSIASTVARAQIVPVSRTLHAEAHNFVESTPPDQTFTTQTGTFTHGALVGDGITSGARADVTSSVLDPATPNQLIRSESFTFARGLTAAASARGTITVVFDVPSSFSVHEKLIMTGTGEPTYSLTGQASGLISTLAPGDTSRDKDLILAPDRYTMTISGFSLHSASPPPGSFDLSVALSVPEPSTCTMAVVSLLAIARRRRR